LYLWYFKAPAPFTPPAPLGITDEPAPDDLVGVYSVPIGSSGAARFGEMLSHGTAELVHLLNRYLTIDKVLPPWLSP
jgi:hypothetical protein